MSSRARHGFTILEVLVSIALLGLITAATFSLLPGFARVNSATTDEQRVTLIAKSYYESAAAFYADPANYNATPPAPGNTTADLTCAPAVITTMNTTTSGTINLKRVALTCTLHGKSLTFQRDYAKP